MSRKVPNLVPIRDWSVYEQPDSMYSEWSSAAKLTNLDGVHTGVPTLTTPTITPTTLRNIEQTFIELQRDTKRSEPHHNEAGFVPPPVDPVTHIQDIKDSLVTLVDNKIVIDDSNSSNSGLLTITTIPSVVPPASAAAPMNRHAYLSPATLPLLQTSTTPPPPTRRNVGGRRPAKSNGLSPEEEERRKVRRERNKLAAARCRKRRLDHTNELLLETQELEEKRQSIQNEIKLLQSEQDHLELLLEAHASNCRLRMGTPPSPPEYKPAIFQTESRNTMQAPTQSHNSQPRCDAATALSTQSQVASPRRPQLGATAGTAKPSRPSSLPVGCKPLEIAGVPITTPSSVIPFNFDSLMEGGTGLTPVGLTPLLKDGVSPIVPSCSSQQRSSNDATSPDSTFPPKQLVSL